MRLKPRVDRDGPRAARIDEVRLQGAALERADLEVRVPRARLRDRLLQRQQRTQVVRGLER